MAKEWEFITRPTTWGGNEYVLREKSPNEGCGCLIAGGIILFVLLALFAFPYKLLDNTFLPYKFKWLSFRDVWIFCLSAWFSLVMVITVLKATLSNRGMNFEDIFETPFLTLGLFSLSLSTFVGYILKRNYSEQFTIAYWINGILLLVIIFLIVRSAKNEKRNLLLFVSFLFLFIPFYYLSTYARIPTSINDTEGVKTTRTETIETLVIVAKNGANIRSAPSKSADISIKLPNNTTINFLSDSMVQEGIIWYKVSYNNQQGWVSKKLVGKQIIN